MNHFIYEIYHVYFRMMIIMLIAVRAIASRVHIVEEELVLEVKVAAQTAYQRTLKMIPLINVLLTYEGKAEIVLIELVHR